MFSLVKFHNEALYVVPSKNVRKAEGKTCVVKFNGGKYSAFLLAKSNNNTYLQDLKRKKQTNNRLHLDSKSTASKESCNNISSSSHFLPPFKSVTKTKQKNLPDNIPIIESNMISSFPEKETLTHTEESNLPMPPSNNLSVSDSRHIKSSKADENKLIILLDLPEEKKSPNKCNENKSENSAPSEEKKIVLLLENSNLCKSPGQQNEKFTEKNYKSAAVKQCENITANNPSFVNKKGCLPSSKNNPDENKLVLLFESPNSPTASAKTCEHFSSSHSVLPVETMTQTQQKKFSDNIPIIESDVILSFPKKETVKNSDESNLPTSPNKNFCISDGRHTESSQAYEKNLVILFDLPVEKKSPNKRIGNKPENSTPFFIDKDPPFKSITKAKQKNLPENIPIIESNMISSFPGKETFKNTEESNLPMPPSNNFSVSDSLHIKSSKADENKLIILLDLPEEKKSPNKCNENKTENSAEEKKIVLLLENSNLSKSPGQQNENFTEKNYTSAVKQCENITANNPSFINKRGGFPSSKNNPDENKLVLLFESPNSATASAKSCKHFSSSQSVLPVETMTQTQQKKSSDNIPIIESNIILSFPKKETIKNSDESNLPKSPNKNLCISDGRHIESSQADEKNLVILFDLPVEKKSPNERIENKPENSTPFFIDKGRLPLAENKLVLLLENSNLPSSKSPRQQNENCSEKNSKSAADKYQNPLCAADKHSENITANNPSFVYERGHHPSSENNLVTLLESSKSPSQQSEKFTERYSESSKNKCQPSSCAADKRKHITLYTETTSDMALSNKDVTNSSFVYYEECVETFNTKDANHYICAQVQRQDFQSMEIDPPYKNNEKMTATNNITSSQSNPLDLTICRNKSSLRPKILSFVNSVRTTKRSISLDCFLGEKSEGFEYTKHFFTSQKHCLSIGIDQGLPNNRHVNDAYQFHCCQNKLTEGIETEAIDESSLKDLSVCSFSNIVTIDSPANIHNSSSFSEVPQNTTASSANMEESAISEYIPDSSMDMRSLDNSKNTSVKAIEVPLDITKVVVPHSKSNYKKHFCLFCQTLQTKISRHLFLKHKKEIEVKRALLLPAKSKERLRIIADLRRRGDLLHNTSVEHNSGILIVPRRQQSKFNNSVDDYICCKKCKGFFSKKTLKLHVSKCASSKNNRSNFVDGRRLTQYMHPVANDVLKCKVFPTLRNDYITKAIRYDELIIKFGNKLTEKYSAHHMYDMIRANLRLLGRFKIHVKKLNPDITELKEIFKPHMFDVCIKAVRTTANWDDAIMGFKTPAVAQSITSLIKKCAKKQRAELIKENNEDLKTQLDNFLLLWEEETPTLINKKALEDQTNKKRDKKVTMPSNEDIKKLHTYLKELVNKAIEKLMDGFCMSTWTDLVQTTLTLIQVFNRKRAGELERMTIENFFNKEAITDRMSSDVLKKLKKLSKDSIKFAQQFVKVNLRGKLGRTVFILLCPLTNKSVGLILKYRSNAGITEENNYVFSKPTMSKLAKQYFRVCPLLKRYSEECGAQMPESIRGTSLRKHIATYSALINTKEADVDKLANFMGHHKDIHKNIYRMSVPAAEIACISKLLMEAIGDEEDGDEEDVEDDEESEVDGHEINITQNSLHKQNEASTSLIEENSGLGDSFDDNSGNGGSSGKKRRSTSPFGKTKRIRWSSDEKAAVFSAFGDIKTLKHLPSLNQCMKAISEQTALKERTPQQIKSWIDNQRRYKTSSSSDCIHTK